MTITLFKHPSPPDQLDSSPVGVEYVPVGANRKQTDTELAVIQFNSLNRKDTASQIIDVDLACLSSVAHEEVWSASSPVIECAKGNISYRKSDDVLFGVIKVNEADFSSLEDCTFQCYREILSLIENERYPSLLRMWNYFSDINSEISNVERYKSFCVGRHKAFSAMLDFERYLPAASAIGTREPGFFLIYFLAAKKPGVQIENPRQISAFHYPGQYGPKSPSFTRAILKNWLNSSQLYISGTASIVGHETLHEKDVAGQLHETFENLKSLIDHVREVHHSKVQSMNNITALKVYIRHQEHYSIIKDHLKTVLSDSVPVLFLQGNICRENLLLEIEGIINFRH